MSDTTTDQIVHEMPSKVISGYVLRRRDYWRGYKRLREICVYRNGERVSGSEALRVLRAEMPAAGGVFDEHRLTLLMDVRFPHNTYSFSGAGKVRTTYLDRMEHALRNDGLATVAMYANDGGEPHEEDAQAPDFTRPIVTLTFDRADLVLVTTSFKDILREMLLQRFTRSDFNAWIGTSSRRNWEFVSPADPLQGVLPQFLSEIAMQLIIVRHSLVFLAGAGETDVEPLVYLGQLPEWAVVYERRISEEEILTGEQAWRLLGEISSG